MARRCAAKKASCIIIAGVQGGPAIDRKPSPDLASWALTFGFTLAIGAVGAFYLGQWLDRRWGTSPWLTIVLVILAIVGSFVRFIRNVTGGDDR